jgi:hypothetical protein
MAWRSGAEERQRWRKAKLRVITIVSGLPRSGTSLMMQMLAAGGMPVLTDGQRQADIENPRGYYEWEPAKLLPQQPQRIREAEDKVVKIISQLLFALPVNPQYHIIFMERPLAEVVASQAEMIRRRQTSAPSLQPSAMIAALQAHLNQVNAWLGARRDISICRVKYGEAVGSAAAVAKDICRFLNRQLDVVAMAAQVDEKLYRQRVDKS